MPPLVLGGWKKNILLSKFSWGAVLVYIFMLCTLCHHITHTQSCWKYVIKNLYMRYKKMAHHRGFHYVIHLSIKMNTFSIYKIDLCKISNIMHSFIHSIGTCRRRRFLTVLRGLFHSSLLYISLPPFSPTSLPSTLTSSCHLFLGLPLSLVVSKFTYNTLLGILFSSILCTCPNQRNLFKPLL